MGRYVRKNAEELMEGRQIRRMKQEERYLAKIEKQMKDAEEMIGELCREGKAVYYVYPVGGRYKESDNFISLFEYLVRNKYI